MTDPIGVDRTVFGPYYGPPPERRTSPEPPLYPPQPLTRTQRRALFATRGRRAFARYLKLTRSAL